MIEEAMSEIKSSTLLPLLRRSLPSGNTTPFEEMLQR